MFISTSKCGRNSRGEPDPTSALEAEADSRGRDGSTNQATAAGADEKQTFLQKKSINWGNPLDQMKGGQKAFG